MRAFPSYTNSYKLFFILYWAGPPVSCAALRLYVLCVLVYALFEPVLYSVALTIVHLNGTPILPLHNITITFEFTFTGYYRLCYLNYLFARYRLLGKDALFFHFVE
jgi:hypothetical protein